MTRRYRAPPIPRPALARFRRARRRPLLAVVCGDRPRSRRGRANCSAGSSRMCRRLHTSRSRHSRRCTTSSSEALSTRCAWRMPAGDVEHAPRLFIDFCDAHWDAIVDILQRRRVQTNECGRSAVIALALAKAATRYGTPAALVDAGASAGLNLLYDRYHLDYGSLGSLGDTSSRVRVTCEVMTPGEALPPRVPAIPRRIGIDREPIDVMSEDDRRWLLACVWPDTGRLQRTADALEIAAEHPPDVRQGDMVDDLASTIDTIDTDGLVCVMTSWAAGYLQPRGRKALGQVLDAIGTRRERVVAQPRGLWSRQPVRPADRPWRIRDRAVRRRCRSFPQRHTRGPRARVGSPSRQDIGVVMTLDAPAIASAVAGVVRPRPAARPVRVAARHTTRCTGTTSPTVAPGSGRSPATRREGGRSRRGHVLVEADDHDPRTAGGTRRRRAPDDDLGRPAAAHRAAQARRTGVHPPGREGHAAADRGARPPDRRRRRRVAASATSSPTSPGSCRRT